jgi:PIN domain nuclease of toxin-antitoxin system
MKRYVFDACALIALINDERGADMVERLLIDAADGKCSISMTKLNLLEVYYGYLRDKGEEFAEYIVNVVENSGIRIFDALTTDLFRSAGMFKASYKISLADAIALAQASIEDASLVTADHHELESVERDGKVKFYWIR